MTGPMQRGYRTFLATWADTEDRPRAIAARGRCPMARPFMPIA